MSSKYYEALAMVKSLQDKIADMEGSRRSSGFTEYVTANHTDCSLASNRAEEELEIGIEEPSQEAWLKSIGVEEQPPVEVQHEVSTGEQSVMSRPPLQPIDSVPNQLLEPMLESERPMEFQAVQDDMNIGGENAARKRGRPRKKPKCN